MSTRPSLRLLGPRPLGDEAVPHRTSFDVLFKTYAPYVARVAWRTGARPGELEDVVQDVFIAALKGADRLRDPQALKSWLATVTVRLMRARLRRRRMWKVLGLDDHAAAAVVDTAVSPDNAAALSKAYEVLGRLPANQQLAWTLRHVEGEPLARVAELCECSLATAKRWIALSQLALEEAFGDG